MRTTIADPHPATRTDLIGRDLALDPANFVEPRTHVASGYVGP